MELHFITSKYFAHRKCERSSKDQVHFQRKSIFGLLSEIESTSIHEVLLDNGWIMAMQEELNQIKSNDVWDLVPKHKEKESIGTKYVFRNKLYEKDAVVRNKVRLVAQGYSQQEVNA